MLGGRRAGLLHKTLGEQAEDWLVRNLDSRRHAGETGTFLAGQANHAATWGVRGGARCGSPGALTLIVGRASARSGGDGLPARAADATKRVDKPGRSE